MLYLPTDVVQQHIHDVGLLNFMDSVIQQLEREYQNWHRFQKSPRHATHYPHGVIELMPCSDDELYGFKYVNGHPANAAQGRLNIVGFGVLAEVATGFPILLTEMTWLTAIRTACMTALVARYGVQSKQQKVGIVGCGAQAEFQCLALSRELEIEHLVYYDIDAAAMTKFANNMATSGLSLKAANSVEEVCRQVTTLVTATAYKGTQSLIDPAWLVPGMFIAAVGGDCPGKTEFSKEILAHFRIVVEYLAQTQVEGEIQALTDVSEIVEFHQIVTEQQPLRRSSEEIVFFDSVGFAIEDLAIMKVLHRALVTQPGVPKSGLIPNVKNAKNLYGSLMDL